MISFVNMPLLSASYLLKAYVSNALILFLHLKDNQIREKRHEIMQQLFVFISTKIKLSFMILRGYVYALTQPTGLVDNDSSQKKRNLPSSSYVNKKSCAQEMALTSQVAFQYFPVANSQRHLLAVSDKGIYVLLCFSKFIALAF